MPFPPCPSCGRPSIRCPRSVIWLPVYAGSRCPSLTALDFLYLAEESLTADAFRFVRQLPRLRKLGLQDVQITDEELLALQTELPGVDVTR
jgi:hypothetical protein